MTQQFTTTEVRTSHIYAVNDESAYIAIRDF